MCVLMEVDDKGGGARRCRVLVLKDTISSLDQKPAWYY